MDDEDPSPRRFHPPTPASTLLTQLQRNQTVPSSNLPLERLCTGVQDIDEYLLLGGVQRGCIVGVSSGDGTGNREKGVVAGGEEGDGEGRLLALHLLARNLLERPGARAAVVDATGSFPVRVLAGVVRWQAERGVGRGEDEGVDGGKVEGKKEVEERVMGVLERVGITRVFDVEGLWEVLGEVGEPNDDKAGREEEGLGDGGERVREREGDEVQNEEIPRGAAKMEIMDSEDDDDDDLNTQRPPKPPPQPPTKPPGVKAPIHPAPAVPAKPHQTTEILLVDNLTTLITTLFALTSPSAAHTLLSQLSRTFATLTRSSSLTVFLLNSLVVKPAKFRQGMEGQPEQQREKRGSVFGGMKATPSLGMVFENFVDLHLMAHRLPRGVVDAEGVYGVERLGTGDEDVEDGDPRSAEDGGKKGKGGNGEGIRFANVIEVLKDECPNLERWEGVSGEERPGRWVGREKRWAVFKVVGGVGLEDDEFGSE